MEIILVVCCAAMMAVCAIWCAMTLRAAEAKVRRVETDLAKFKAESMARDVEEMRYIETLYRTVLGEEKEDI